MEGPSNPHCSSVYMSMHPCHMHQKIRSSTSLTKTPCQSSVIASPWCMTIKGLHRCPAFFHIVACFFPDYASTILPPSTSLHHGVTAISDYAGTILSPSTSLHHGVMTISIAIPSILHVATTCGVLHTAHTSHVYYPTSSKSTITVVRTPLGADASVPNLPHTG
ncbi:hypothetical protein D1007_18664 [Hordeum vulgare]|nr:hypothetical protein D1007_18664 [Hordeum vulgare]